MTKQQLYKLLKDKNPVFLQLFLQEINGISFPPSTLSVKADIILENTPQAPMLWGVPIQDLINYYIENNQELKKEFIKRKLS